MPGQYLPQPYMSSYVPNYYGFNASIRTMATTCNRYANGVVYQVDCDNGMVEDVIPTLRERLWRGADAAVARTAYYNVPSQYRQRLL